MSEMGPNDVRLVQLETMGSSQKLFETLASSVQSFCALIKRYQPSVRLAKKLASVKCDQCGAASSGPRQGLAGMYEAWILV